MDVVALQPTTPETKARKGLKIFWPGLDSAAVLFWSYAIIKLFVFDVDVYLTSLVSSEFVWLLNYKLLIFLGFVVVAMLVTKRLVLGLAVSYIALFPLVILFWKLPRFVWRQKSWLFAFAILNAAIGVIRSFRRDFISGTLFLISAVLILGASNQYVLYGAALSSSHWWCLPMP